MTRPDRVQDIDGAWPSLAEIEAVVALAIRAPSIHDSQPWRFVLTPDALELSALRLDVHHGSIRIEVYDDGPGVPVERRVRAEDVGGRGLRIVDSLSTSWGTIPRPAGKCVWCEMPVASMSTAHLDCTYPP